MVQLPNAVPLASEQISLFLVASHVDLDLVGFQKSSLLRV